MVVPISLFEFSDRASTFLLRFFFFLTVATERKKMQKDLIRGKSIS